MAVNANELFSSVTVAALLRVIAWSIRPKTFASGSGTLALLTPVAKIKSTGFYQKWTAPISEVNVITPTGTVSGGGFTITVNGETTATIAHNANAAAIKAALVLLGGIGTDDLAVTGGALSAATAVTITWAGKLAKQAIAFSITDSVTGGGSLAATEGTAGVGDNGLTGAYEIAGFVWADAVTLDADEEVVGNVLMKGAIHFDDIPIVTGYTSDLLKEALRNGGVRQLGFTIDGLSGV